MYEIDYGTHVICQSYEDVSFLRRYAYELAWSYAQDIFEEEAASALPGDGGHGIIQGKSCEMEYV